MLVMVNDINDDNEIIVNVMYLSFQVYVNGEEVLDNVGNINDVICVIVVKLMLIGV